MSFAQINNAEMIGTYLGIYLDTFVHLGYLIWGADRSQSYRH